MNPFTIVTLVLICLLYALESLHFLHMFQLNSYRPERQLRWFKGVAVRYLLTTVLPLSVSVVLCSLMQTVWKYGILCGILVALVFHLPKKAKKPLVYTKRVVRLIITHALIFVAILTVTASFFNTLLLRAGLLMCILTPFSLLLSNLVNKPLELSINHYYINDAKRLLKEHPSLTVIGVTGSYGKTSVKYILGSLLEAKYNVLITPESYNTPLGITKTIRSSLRATADIFVCEMGAKNVGDIREICKIVNPDIGVITSVGPQHLETFKTLDNVKRTKFELADAVESKGHGKLFINGEDANITEYNKNPNAVSYGLHPDCTYYANSIETTYAGTRFTVKHGKEEVAFTTSLIGRHNVINIVGGIAVCCELGIPMNRLVNYVKALKSVSHRLEVSVHGKTTVIDDAYNSNPKGANAALDTLAMFNGYKIIITPGMIELGSVQEEENRKFGRHIGEVCDYAILVGKSQTKSIYNGIKQSGFDGQDILVVDTVNEAAEKAYTLPIPEGQQRIVLFENDLPDNY